MLSGTNFDGVKVNLKYGLTLEIKTLKFKKQQFVTEKERKQI